MAAGRKNLHAPSSALNVAEHAGRTLEFLGTIERTVDSATRDAGMVRGICLSMSHLRARVEALAGAGELDTDGTVCEALDKAAAIAERLYQNSVARRAAAQADKHLHDEDGLVECLQELAESFADLHDVIQDLKRAVEINDGLASPAIGRYKSLQDLLAALKA